MSESSVEYEVSDADVLRLFEHYSRTSPTSRKLRRLVLVVVPIVAGLFMAYGLRPRPDAVVWAGGGAVLLAIILVLGGPLLNRTVWRRSIREAKRTLLGRRMLSIDADGIRSSSEDSNSSIRWSAVSRIDDDEGHIYLMLGGGGIVVPKRAFASASEIEGFLQRARELQQSGN